MLPGGSTPVGVSQRSAGGPKPLAQRAWNVDRVELLRPTIEDHRKRESAEERMSSAQAPWRAARVGRGRASTHRDTARSPDPLPACRAGGQLGMEVIAVTSAGHENPQRSRMAFISWLSASLPDPLHSMLRST